MTDHTKTVLVKGQHFLPLDENKQICKGENGGLLIFDEISGRFLKYQCYLRSSFFDLSIDNKAQIWEDTEKTQVKDLLWDDKAVKLLFTLYKDHQEAFKSTSIKNDVVWDKIRIRMKTDKGYNFTRTQIKDKWTNIRKNYMRVKNHNKTTGAALKNYRYYNEMDDIFGDKSNVNPIAIASNMRAKDENISSCSEDNSVTEDDQHIRKKSIVTSVIFRRR